MNPVFKIRVLRRYADRLVGAESSAVALHQACHDIYADAVLAGKPEIDCLREFMKAESMLAEIYCEAFEDIKVHTL